MILLLPVETQFNDSINIKWPHLALNLKKYNLTIMEMSQTLTPSIKIMV